MKTNMDEIEARIEETVSLLNDGVFGFDKNFVLKSIVVAFGEGAELGPEKFSSANGEKLLKQIESGWGDIEAAFQQTT